MARPNPKPKWISHAANNARELVGSGLIVVRTVTGKVALERDSRLISLHPAYAVAMSAAEKMHAAERRRARWEDR